MHTLNTTEGRAAFNCNLVCLMKASLSSCHCVCFLAGVVFRPRGKRGPVSGAVEQGSPASHDDARGSRQQHGAGPHQLEGEMGIGAGEGC